MKVKRKKINFQDISCTMLMTCKEQRKFRRTKDRAAVSLDKGGIHCDFCGRELSQFIRSSHPDAIQEYFTGGRLKWA